MKYIRTFLYLFFLHSSVSHAALTIDIVDSGTGVVATTSGQANIDGLVFRNQVLTTSAFVRGSSSFAAFDGWITLGTGDMDAYNLDTTVVFSTGLNFLTNITSGPPVGLQSENLNGTDALYLPKGYVSGTVLSTSARWAGQTIVSMGLIPGVHVISWGSGPTADTLTINIGGAAPPSSYPIEVFVSGLTGTGLQLQNNGGDTLTITANDFTDFPTLLADGASYSVSILSQPTGQACTITSGGSGTIAGGTAHVDVDCATDGGPPPPPPPVNPGAGATATATPVPALPFWALLAMSTLLLVVGRRKLQ